MLFLALTVAALLFMSKRLRNSSLIEYLLMKMPFHQTITRIYDAIHHYGTKPWMTFKAGLLSILIQIPGFAGIWILTKVLNIQALSLLDYLIALPVCVVINAIPIAPGGIGVGEAGFRQIFLVFGSNEGAELAFLFHVVFFLIAIGFGGFLYIFSDFSQKKPIDTSPY